MSNLTAAVERLDALLEKATPGPWQYVTLDDHDAQVTYCCVRIDSEIQRIGLRKRDEEDARFIVAARNDLPALLVAYREQEGELERLRFFFDRDFDTDDMGKAGWRCEMCPHNDRTNKLIQCSGAECIDEFMKMVAELLNRPDVQTILDQG